MESNKKELNDEDKCVVCNGKATWEIIDKNDWDDFMVETLNDFPGAKIFKSCSQCNETGKESVRLTWEEDRLNPQKHPFKIWCDNESPCWHCKKLKKEHLN